MPRLPNAALLIPAAGDSLRLGGSRRKPRLLLAGRPLLEWTLQAFAACSWIRRRAVALHPDDLRWARARWTRWRRWGVTHVLTGGATRADSVCRAFEEAVGPVDGSSPADAPGLVLIHDGARPFVSRSIIERVARAAAAVGAAVPAVRAVDTLKEGRPAGRPSPDGAAVWRVARTLPRSTSSGRAIWQVQTPQAFRTEVLRKAILADRRSAGRGKGVPTDDAGWVERTGAPVALVPGSALNFKITTPEDMVLARALVRVGDCQRTDCR